jgi:hypothetical protein
MDRFYVRVRGGTVTQVSTFERGKPKLHIVQFRIEGVRLNLAIGLGGGETSVSPCSRLLINGKHTAYSLAERTKSIDRRFMMRSSVVSLELVPPCHDDWQGCAYRCRKEGHTIAIGPG